MFFSVIKPPPGPGNSYGENYDPDLTFKIFQEGIEVGGCYFMKYYAHFKFSVEKYKYIETGYYFDSDDYLLKKQRHYLRDKSTNEIITEFLRSSWQLPLNNEIGNFYLNNDEILLVSGPETILKSSIWGNGEYARKFTLNSIHRQLDFEVKYILANREAPNNGDIISFEVNAGEEDMLLICCTLFLIYRFLGN